ncbi:MAG: GNAT family N-acetyltransferase, partial [Bacilli bacterium]|nr:GNAT family N-acetyltransferase [Bacilli bacterium]
YIALDNNKIIGTIALENKSNIVIFKIFYVDKNYKKLGIGNLLYEMIETYIKEKTKIKKVILTCNEILTDAHKFYLKRGYKQVAHLELELEHLDNDYFFIKSILR